MSLHYLFVTVTGQLSDAVLFNDLVHILIASAREIDKHRALAHPVLSAHLVEICEALLSQKKEKAGGYLWIHRRCEIVFVYDAVRLGERGRLDISQGAQALLSWSDGCKDAGACQ